MDNNTLQSVAVSPQQASLNNKKVFIVAILLEIITLLVAGYFGYQYFQLKSVQTPTNQFTPQIERQISVSKNESPEWKTAHFLDSFSYDYPANWHVAAIPDGINLGGTDLFLDPNPIVVKNGDSWFSTFTINVLNGFQNPAEEFEKRKAEFSNANYSDITSEIIDNDLGAVYHFTGKVKGEYRGGTKVEKYYMLFQRNKNDPINQEIITASIGPEPNQELSNILRHIILSMKKIQN